MLSCFFCLTACLIQVWLTVLSCICRLGPGTLCGQLLFAHPLFRLPLKPSHLPCPFVISHFLSVCSSVCVGLTCSVASLMFSARVVDRQWNLAVCLIQEFTDRTICRAHMLLQSCWQPFGVKLLLSEPTATPSPTFLFTSLGLLYWSCLGHWQCASLTVRRLASLIAVASDFQTHRDDVWCHSWEIDTPKLTPLKE